MNLINYKKIEILEQLVENNKFLQAYEYYLDKSMTFYKIENQIILENLLKFNATVETKEIQSLYKLYKEAYKRGDYDKAREYLKEYKSLIKGTSMDRELDYKFARIESERIRINNPNFVILEHIYDEALYYYQNKDYQKSLKNLKEYISLDNGRNPDAHRLLGRVYWQLKEYDLAIDILKEGLLIRKEPSIYSTLSMINYSLGNFKESLNYLLEYEKRKPNQEKNLRAIVNAYWHLGNTAKRREYLKKWSLVRKR